MPSPYPGALPPPVPYPKPRRRKPLLIAGIAILSVAVIAAVVAALVAFVGQEEATDATVTPARAQTAIQEYMDALSRGDTEVVARNASCGLFEEIKDRKADMSLAKLASDAFRRQYKSAEVTSIDKVVTWSPNQAQVLFTMQVQPARAQGQAERQGVAQILTLDDELLICSYLPRTGQF
ncbi:MULTISPECIES: hypothetical protein [unclassified Mycolicibacterium]|uniref:Rv0361 family membrane protein n=1 Tax=unclassified Mycolicibacterium TaxID=2636767 RepID=UPI001F4BF49D|nr:hypothetical protein [Mycolicibacterium sp. YH-1]UNB55158.1 hypothetical protein L0M16_13060 [Mycolicibacterium sp. YH-1]